MGVYVCVCVCVFVCVSVQMRVDVCAGVHVFDYINVRVLAEYSPNPQAVQNEDRYKVYIHT